LGHGAVICAMPFLLGYMEENEMIAFSKKFDVLFGDIKLHLS